MQYDIRMVQHQRCSQVGYMDWAAELWGVSKLKHESSPPIQLAAEAYLLQREKAFKSSQTIRILSLLPLQSLRLTRRREASSMREARLPR